MALKNGVLFNNNDLYFRGEDVIAIDIETKAVGREVGVDISEQHAPLRRKIVGYLIYLRGIPVPFRVEESVYEDVKALLKAVSNGNH